MKQIRVKDKTWYLNDMNYLWNGCVLQAIIKKGKYQGQILETIPKKYYQDILFSLHKTSFVQILDKVPSTFKETNKPTGYILIITEDLERK